MRPTLAALASAIVPGAGQLLVGKRRRGIVLLSVSALAIAFTWWMSEFHTLTVQTWFVRPVALRWLLAANGATLAFRVYATLDAFLATNTGKSTLLALGASSLLGLTTIAVLAYPHFWAGERVVANYDLITTVFRSAPSPTVATPTSSPTTPPTNSDVGFTTTTAEPSLVLQPPPITTTTIAARIWDGQERLNVLLLGGDAGPGRRGVRTDTIIVASLEPKTGHAALFSVPRNMARVPFPEQLDVWECDCFPGIINALWKYGTDHPEKFSGPGPPGAEALKLAIAELTGLTIHYYALVNLQGFVDVIDALGGIDITIPTRLFDSDYPHEDGGREVIDIQPGKHHLDGHTALAYARSRQQSDDYSRMNRQHCVLQAVVAQADPVTVIRVFPDIANSIKNNVTTDIPLERLPDLIALLPKLNADELISIRLVPPRYTGPRTPEGYNTPDLTVIREHIKAVVTLSPLEAVELLELASSDEECA